MAIKINKTTLKKDTEIEEEKPEQIETIPDDDFECEEPETFFEAE